jgi:DNA-binding transcriptional LysR family regulator
MMGAVELRQIQYFVVVARQQSFSRAAEAVGVAQPALSQQMKRLEAELGVTLLDLSSRPVRLTEAGVAFQARAERMLAEAGLAREEMREFAGVGRGRLVVGALPALAGLWLPPVLGRFHATYPRIELGLREANTEELSRLLGAGELDLALLHAVPGLYTGGPSYRGLVMEELVVVVPPAHGLAGRPSVELRALRDERFVLLTRGSGLSHTILAAATAEGFTPEVVAECASMTTLRALVAEGIGISIIPALPARAAGPPVAAVALRPALPAHAAAVAWRGDSRPSAPAEALLGVIRDQVAAAG